MTVALSAVDVGSSGLERTTYSLDGSDPCASEALGYAEPIVITAASTLRACSRDRAGNVGEAGPLDIGVDLSAPSLAITCNGGACNSSWYTSGVLVALGAVANGPASIRDIRVTLDGAASADGRLYTGPFTLSKPSLIRATAFNLAGTPSNELSQPLQIDTEAPTIGISAPLNGASVTGTQAILTLPADNVAVTRVRFYLDSKQLGTRVVAPWKWNWDTTTASRGTHVLSARAEDAAGNGTSTAPINVVVR